jgi:hypothetical protein
MFDVIRDVDQIKLIHKLEGHEYIFPICKDEIGERSLALGVMAQNASTETSANDFAEEARTYAEALVTAGKETRAILVWYVDEINTNLEEVRRLLRRGWIVDSVSPLSPGLRVHDVVESLTGWFWKKR